MHVPPDENAPDAQPSDPTQRDHGVDEHPCETEPPEEPPPSASPESSAHASEGASPESSAHASEGASPESSAHASEGASAHAHAGRGAPAHEEGPRRRIERILPELIRRGLEKGIEAGLGTLQTLSRTDEALRGVVSDVKDVKLPREVAGYVFQAIEDTKNGMLRVVGREVREFLEATDLATEMQKALTSLSFEIKTEIRFIPNEAGTGVRPEIKAGRTSVKRNVDGRETSGEAAAAAEPVPSPDGEPPEEGRRSLLRHRPRARRKE